MNDIETKYYLEGKKIIFEKTNNNVLYYMYSKLWKENLHGRK